MQNDKIKKKNIIKKIEEIFFESTRVNLTNPPPSTWDWDEIINGWNWKINWFNKEFKTKYITIKRSRTKSNIKIKCKVME